MLFNNSFENTYEEIKTWNPVWYRKVSDMDALWRVFGKQMDEIQGHLIQLVNNNFIYFADEVTITRLEKFLNIKHLFPRTLVERRNIIKGFIIGQGHIGRQTIIELVSVFTSGNVDVSFSKGVITISVNRDFDDRFNLSDINLILGHRIPAHLALGIVDFPRPVRVENHNRFSFKDLWMVRFSIRNRTARVIGPRLNSERLLDGIWLLNSTKHGIGFINFHVKSVIKNHGEIVYGERLNGRAQLDGLFILNGGLKRILSGITSRCLVIKGVKFHNSFSIKAGINYRLKVKNSQDFKLNTFNIYGRFINRKVFEYGEMINGTRNLNGIWNLEAGRITRPPLWGIRLDNQKFLDSDWLLNGGLQHLFHGLSAHRIKMGIYKFKNKNYLSATLIKKGSWYLDGEFTLNGINTIEKYIIKEAI